MKKPILLLICFSFMAASSCQPKEIKINILSPETIPNNIKVSGKVLEVKSWSDKNGENLLVISRYRPKTKTFPNQPGFTTENAFLYITQYLQEGQNYRPLWSYQDSIVNCETDYWIGPLENSLSITDLNSDLFSETTIVYSYACRGDISPSKMKVLLFDRTKLYYLKGTMYSKLVLGDLDSASFECNLSNIESFKNALGSQKYRLQIGRYENEDNFSNSPKEFLEFAKTKWRSFMTKDQFRQLNGTNN